MTGAKDPVESTLYISMVLTIIILRWAVPVFVARLSKWIPEALVNLIGNSLQHNLLVRSLIAWHYVLFNEILVTQVVLTL